MRSRGMRDAFEGFYEPLALVGHPGLTNDARSLRKDERRRLLAELERTASRTEAPEQTLQRARQALAERNLPLARRLVAQLEGSSPHLAGLEVFRAQMSDVERELKNEENVRTAETMLTGYIQQRKKQLALFALDTLAELAPHHPRLPEYRIWVNDLDQEVALQERIDSLVATGRAALQTGDLDGAGQELEALRRLDPYGQATEHFEAELAAAQQGRAAGQTIQQLKREIEQRLDAGDTDGAQASLDALRALDVPKITIDQILKRIHGARRRLDDAAEVRTLTAQFERFLEAGAWQNARELAQQFGRRFPNDPRASALFNRVAEVEADARRQQSLQQGIRKFDELLALGDRAGAEMALGLLRKLDVDSAVFAQLEERLRRG
ncbi:MAG: hypothetical protein AAGC60_07100 [Acidobacteriota bacterium]